VGIAPARGIMRVLPVKIAITAWQDTSGWSGDSVCTQAERAERMGFHSYWLPENHFSGRQAIPSPLTLLAAAAVRTARIRLGTTSYLLPIRHPIQAAEEVAVVDQLSRGRLILGLGRGIQDAVFEVFGVPGREKRARFAANLEIMRQAWRGEPVAEPGDGEPVRLCPLPVQQPHPPLWVAAFGPLALKQAGGLGLPYLCSPLEPLADLVANIAIHRQAAQAAGRQLEGILPLMRTVFISEDTAAVARVRARLASSLPPGLRRGDVAVEAWAIIGDRHYARDRLAEYRERLGVTHLIGGGRLPVVEERLLLQSHQWLAEMGEATA
jgi:alkanesulfonate monooxygenase SsuD/methylene tetrahydromethanopterin reductase-like flavin-dependent oxidoreductase (luciferase family)